MKHILTAPAASAAYGQPRPDLKGKAAIETMADDMRVILTRTGSVTKEDLFQFGWTSVQVTLYGEPARELAVRLSVSKAA